MMTGIATWLMPAGAMGAVAGLILGRQRMQLSLAKHGSLAGHSKLSRRVARLVPFYDYDGDRFFASDDCPPEIAQRRRAGFDRLAERYRTMFPRSAALTAEVRPGLSDLQFTGSYRVPFQYSRLVRERLAGGNFLAASQGVQLIDLDGNRLYDLTGSYGVNLLGYETYKACIAEAVEQAGGLGPVLGGYHPVVADNVARLRALSGLDEVSFHMSGTEAVMQAVRLARYHTGRSHLARFTGAYHGWWGEVQPGVGNPVPEDRTYTLADMSDHTLTVLARRRDIACVLINPLQALHPNSGAPADSALVDSSRRAGVDRKAYGDWLRRLADICRANGVVLILDDVFTGFRLAMGGAQEYFGIRPDLVTYGKTLGGGLPVGVLCGRADLMRRYRDDRPVDICFARGTFNSHPYVMAAMNAFLRRLDTPEVRQLYDGLDERWDERAARLNAMLSEDELPVRVANLSTIWTVCYTAPSRYNWMLQFYLRAEGLALSWVGTGRIIFSLDYDDAAFDEVASRFVAAGRKMRDDGWWWSNPALTDKAIRRRMLREMLVHRFSGSRR